MNDIRVLVEMQSEVCFHPAGLVARVLPLSVRSRVGSVGRVARFIAGLPAFRFDNNLQGGLGLLLLELSAGGEHLQICQR